MLEKHLSQLQQCVRDALRDNEEYTSIYSGVIWLDDSLELCDFLLTNFQLKMIDLRFDHDLFKKLEIKNPLLKGAWPNGIIIQMPKDNVIISKFLETNFCNLVQ